MSDHHGELLIYLLSSFTSLEFLLVKWLNVITSRAEVPGLEHELEDALYCPYCLASCSEIRYQVRGAMTLALHGLYKPKT